LGALVHLNPTLGCLIIQQTYVQDGPEQRTILMGTHLFYFFLSSRRIAAGVDNDNIAIGELDPKTSGLEVIVPSDVMYICAYHSDGTAVKTNAVYSGKGNRTYFKLKFCLGNTSILYSTKVRITRIRTL
jgi:hypothetical protein